MTQYTRKTQKVFAGDVPATGNVAQFGSAKAGSPLYTTDPDQIQGLAAFGQGLAGAVVGNNAPYLQDINALMHLVTRQLAYLLQSGIPEWDAGTTYYYGDIVRDSSGTIYISKSNDNLNNALTNNPSYWLTNRSLEKAGTIKLWGGTTEPTGHCFADGRALLIADYPDLWAAYGTTWNTAKRNESPWGNWTTDAGYFRVPDLRTLFVRAPGTNAAGVTTTHAVALNDTTALVGAGGTGTSDITATAAGQTLGTTNIALANGTTSSQSTATTGSSHDYHYDDVPDYSSGGDYQVPSGDGAGGLSNASHTHSYAHTHGVTGTTNIGHTHAASSVSFTNAAAETRPDCVGMNYIIKLYNDLF